MEPVAVQQNNFKGEKEHDKLLAQNDHGKGQCYGNVGNKCPIEARNSFDGTTSLNSSVTQRLSPQQKTSKDKYLKSLSEEDVPKANCKKKALKVVVTGLFIVIVVGIVIIWTFHEGRSKKHIGNQYFDFISKKRVLNLYREKDDIIFSGIIRASDYDIGKVKNCYDTETETDYCFIFDDGAIFRFIPYDLGTKEEEIHCTDIIWENLKTVSQFPVDCYDIEYGLWYGIPNFKGPFWPLKPGESSLDALSYRPFSGESLGHILENLWVSTIGISIAAHQQVPIQISFDSGHDKKLCISLDRGSIQSVPGQSFNYSICSGPNVKETFLAVRNTYFSPTPVLDLRNHDLSQIVWKYENKYETNPGYSFGVFLHKLNTLELPIRMVQYDTDWEENTGDIKFNVITQNTLAQYLKGKYSGARLLLPITLSCSYLSDNFRTGASKNYFAKDIQTGAFKTVLYEDQSCALWDASNPSARTFLAHAIDTLQQKGTLEETLYPQGFEFQTAVSNEAFPISLFKNTSRPNAINVEFTEFLLSLGKSVLMETAYQMQNLTIFVEIPTHVANKDGKKCLDYTIPAALTAGIHGYPYVMTVAPSEEKVDKELFIRWLQVAAFFPGLKVTNAVAKFGETALTFAKNMSQYRDDVVMPILSEFVGDVANGVPIIRPLWWLEPADYKTFNIADQFLIGDSIMVAPILCHGDRQRDVYLPQGKWKFAKTGDIYPGKQWLNDFEIALHEIAVFELQIKDKNGTNTESPV